MAGSTRVPLATDPVTGTKVAGSRFVDLSPERLYALLRLRSAVFVVEQDCVYLDLDDRDHEADTEHLWIDDEHGLAATIRLLHDGDGRWHLGRVCTRADARSAGVGAAIVRAGLSRLHDLGARRIDISAQAHLQHWYEGFGFCRCGEGYLEDGIPHVPMTLAPTTAPES